MSESSRFEPIFPSHAIERCGITVIFREPLPQKLFGRVVPIAQESAARKGLLHTAIQQFGMTITAAGPQPVPGVSPHSFNAPDQSASLFLAPNLLFWQSSRYVRWTPFVSEFRDIASVTLREFLNFVSLAAVKLEYWDRFNWTGTWADCDVAQLIRGDADKVVAGWRSLRNQWHSHAGWFEVVEGHQRLINLNVDVGEMNAKPSVSIYTFMQDEWGVGKEDINERCIFDRLESLHRDLKVHLDSVLQESMVEKIGLRLGA